MSAQPGSGRPPLQELSERLLHHPHPGGPTSAQLFVEQLPDAFPPDLPLPHGGRLLGSLLKTLGGRPATIDAILDVDGDPATLLGAYEAELKSGGWNDFEGFGPPQGGFISGDRGDGRALRRGAEGPVLMVSAVAREDQPSDVRVKVDWETFRRPQQQPHPGPPGAGLLPPLRLPPGVVMRGASGSGGGGYWSSDATVHTERSVPELEAHFAMQLAHAGWTRTAGGADDAVGWSAWRVPGSEGWRGLLIVLAPFGATERNLTLRAQRHQPSDVGASGYVALS
ncbi:MAG: hypothetical protein ACRENL_11470 [Candidatus Dormibacteria bacterium]